MSSRKRPRPSVKSTIVDDTGPSTRKMSFLALAHEREQSMKKRENELSALSLHTRQAVNDILREHGVPQDEGIPSFSLTPDTVLGEEYNDDLLDLSHEGGEYQDLSLAFEEMIAPAKTSKRRYTTAGRRERTSQMHKHWGDQMSELTDAYLLFESGDAEPSVNSPGEDLQDTAISQFNVLTIETASRRVQTFQQRQGELANTSLLRFGFLGCSPVTPSIAISLTTLKLYYRLRRRHPRLSIQSMVKSLCDLQDVNYQLSFREQFSIAFDAYLNILRCVQLRMDAALGRNTPDWRIKNSCPCCNYELENETPLVPRRLNVLDGNNSAKRTASSGTEDPRVFASDYFLTREEVDVFKDEVKSRSKRKSADCSSDSEYSDNDDDTPWLDGDRNPDNTERYTQTDPCTKNWKASAAEHKKRALDIYDVTGMFASACRHGFILMVCEMVRSGELAKYPLALTNYILDIHGEDNGFGYDIGCSFEETIKNSPLLASKAERLRMQLIVAAFHAYKHGRLCQLRYHPAYRLGLGLEDLEGMERVFSASNSVAPCIRYASMFHWKQYLDLHFTQWDEDKYGELSRFLYNNYVQALTIIKDYTPHVEEMKERLKITDADIDNWLKEELEFFLNLKDEPNERVLESAYVRALYNRQDAETKLQELRTSLLAQHNYQYGTDTAISRKVEASLRAAQDRFLTAVSDVEHLEHKLSDLGVDVPWAPNHPKLLETLGYIQTRDFHRALDRVQQLVTQRLLELSKTHMSGTGYKMRTQIGKALQRRGKAIRTALDKYNKLARKMHPPAPTLAWKDVVSYSFVAEFELLKLCYSQKDVTVLPWVSPINREGAAKFHKIRRAKEEIVRLNVEIRRLATAIADEHVHWQTCIDSTTKTSPLIAAQLRAAYGSRRRVNLTHVARLDAITKLPMFSGTVARGTRLGTARDHTDLGGDTAPLENVGAYGLGEEEDLDVEMNDELNNTMSMLGDFMETISVSS